MITNMQHSKGFTLVEILLVMVIIGGLMIVGAGYVQQRTESLRVDRASGQMQQILNAGMSYYIANTNTWPASLSALQTAGYLPSPMTSPFGTSYGVYSTTSNLYVWVQMPTPTSSAPLKSAVTAKIIAGTLPLAFTTINTPSATQAPQTCLSGGACHVVASVNIPPQSLGDSKTVSFAGLYHNGACVIAPTCETGYKAQAFAVPVSVSGFYSAPDPSSSPCTATDKSGCVMTYYPLNGFTAYTTSDDPVAYATSQPINCGTGVTTTGPCYEDSTSTTQIATNISVWRVCISVTTSSGEVAPTVGNAFRNPWGQLTGTVMVMTRCTKSDGSEETGSGFTVWEPSS